MLGGQTDMTIGFGTLTALFPLVLLLFGLVFTVVVDSYLRRDHRKIMLIILALCATLIVQNLWENDLFISRTGLLLKGFLSAYGFAVRPVILILFLQSVQPDGKKWPLWASAGGNAALYFSSPLTKWCFQIREFDFAFLRGPLWISSFILSAVLLALLLLRSLFLFRETKKLEQLIPVFVAVCIIAAAEDPLVDTFVAECRARLIAIVLCRNLSDYLIVCRAVILFSTFESVLWILVRRAFSSFVKSVFDRFVLCIYEIVK